MLVATTMRSYASHGTFVELFVGRIAAGRRRRGRQESITMGTTSGYRVHMFVSDSVADEFESDIKQAAIERQVSSTELKVRRGNVKGQSVELSELAKFIITLSSGAGGAVALKIIARTVVDLMKARRGNFTIERPGGVKISLENYSAAEVEKVLRTLRPRQ